MNTYKWSIITFGSPNIGDYNFTRYVNFLRKNTSLTLTTFYSEYDLIARMPLKSNLRGYDYDYYRDLAINTTTMKITKGIPTKMSNVPRILLYGTADHSMQRYCNSIYGVRECTNIMKEYERMEYESKNSQYFVCDYSLIQLMYDSTSLIPNLPYMAYDWSLKWLYQVNSIMRNDKCK